MSDLIVRPIALIGGLEDSKAKPDPTDFKKLENFTLFRGRFSLRAPFIMVQEGGFLDDAGTPAAITHGLFVVPHINKLFVIGHSTVTQKTYLYECNADGSSPANKAVIWSDVGTVPRPVATSFHGGSAIGGTSRLFICDYDGQQETRYWDGTAMNDLAADFDNNASNDDVKYTLVQSYQFHLWGTGFYQGTAARPEMIRFSQPGLIPATDPDGQSGTREWFINDFRTVGTRGDRMTATGLAGGSMILFKSRQAFSLFGYDRESWAVKMLTERSGAVGPYASASTGDGLCFFWAERGPCVTDGSEVFDLSEEVRQHVIEADGNDKTIVTFSPDDGLVYFIYSGGGSSDPNTWLGYDKERKRWTEGFWFNNEGVQIKMKHALAIPTSTLPGPIAAPNSLKLVAIQENRIDLTWRNGDTALDTVTEIYRSLTSPATLKIATVTSGVTTYQAVGLAAKTTYFFKVRHVRNRQNSAYAEEASAKTKLMRPTGFDAYATSVGISVTLFNNEAGADVIIERRTSASFVGSLEIEHAFNALNTLTNQSVGLKTYSDTAVVLSQSYDYRAKVTKTSETDSEYTEIDRSIPFIVSTITNPQHAVIHTVCWKVNVSWDGTVAKSSDLVLISRIQDGVTALAALAPHSQKIWVDEETDWQDGATPATLQYKLELLDGMLGYESSTVIDTVFTAESDEDVADCFIEEQHPEGI